jgi:hypothetical protein
MSLILDGSAGITTPMYNGAVSSNQVTPTTAFKNRIINGQMQIDQRNAGASGTGASNYTVDRWYYYGSQSSKGTWQQNAGAVTPPVGFTNYLGFTSSSAYAVGSGDVFAFFQRIEGFNIADLAWGTANAKTVTLSFQVYSSLTGTFGGSIQNGSSNRSYPFAYTVSSANTWTSISVTIAGDTIGTWATNNTSGLQLNFGLGAGSSFSGTAGAWNSSNNWTATGATSVVGTSGATFYITGVQLEVGSSATSFDYRPYGTELALCQRYYWRNKASDPYTYLANAITAGSSNATLFGKTPVTMRTNPTIAVSNVAVYAGSSIIGFSTLATNRSSPDMMTIDFTGTGFTPTLVGSAVISNNNSSAYLEVSAEL